MGICRPAQAWLGTVVPKRHARRAVTRSLMKRQVRAAVARVAAVASPPVAAAVPGLPGGLWVVRLRAPYPRDAFPSAASDALRGAVRAELDRLIAAAVRQCTGRAMPRRHAPPAGGAR